MANSASDELVERLRKHANALRRAAEIEAARWGDGTDDQVDIEADAGMFDEAAALLARLEAEKAEVERLRELFKVQSDSHAKHVRGLLAQHAVELDIYAKAAQDFREQAQAEKARADKATSHWNTQPTIADVAAANYRAKETVRRLAETEAARDRLAAVAAEARRVIEPFAKGSVWDHFDDDAPLTNAAMHGVRISARHLRAARAWQDKHGEAE